MADTAMSARELARWKQLGVHPHGNRWRHRVRIDGKRPNESFATPQECLRRIEQLQDARNTGSGYQPPIDRSRTLGSYADEVYLLRCNGRNAKGEPLREQSRAAITFKFKPWRSGPLAARPVRLVTATDVAAWHADRHAVRPASADRELRTLRDVLDYAAAHGAQVDPAIALVKPRGHVRRRRKALQTVAQLEWFAALARPYARRQLLLQGTLGNRISELHDLTDDRVQLDRAAGEGSIFIPAALCKENEDKYLDLLPDEVELLAEQLDAPGPRLVGSSATSHLPPRTPNPEGLVFPNPKGTRWHPSNYRRQVIDPACEAAAAAWPDAWGPSPFPNFTSHDLRATAVTLACQARIPEAAVAARVGHRDAGRLVREIYDQTDRRELAREVFRTMVPEGLRGGGRGAAHAVESADTAPTQAAPGKGSG